MYNKKLLSKIDLGKFKKVNPYSKDIITDPAGQYNHPGKPTRIPSNNITMKGVGYPVLGIANNGQKQMMQPGKNYNFPGAKYVDEYPQIKKGGSLKSKKSYQNGGPTDPPQSFYEYALAERQRLMSMPEAWQGDPDFENPDGTFNLCIDCLNPNYENEQDLRDMNRLIEEGYTREIPHYGKDLYMAGITKYNIPMPVPGSKIVKPTEEPKQYQSGGTSPGGPKILTPEQQAYIKAKKDAANKVVQAAKSGNRDSYERLLKEFQAKYPNESFTCPSNNCPPADQLKPQPKPVVKQEAPKPVPVREVMQPMPTLRPTFTPKINPELQKFVYPETETEDTDVMPVYDETDIEIGTPGPGGHWEDKTSRYIDWDGNSIGFNGIRFRKPGHGGDLIKKGARHYIHYPSIEKRYDAWIEPDEYQDGGEPGDKFKKRLMKRYPGMQGVYGPEGENLTIVKDPNYDARSVGFGDIEFQFPDGDSEIRYPNLLEKDGPEYIYPNPSPNTYLSLYNPRGANRGDIFLDMMHGMRDDPNYQPLLQNFEKAVKDARGEDMTWQYEGEVADGSTQSRDRFDENYVDSQLRAQLSPGSIGMFSHGRKDYRMDRKYDSPEMRAAAKDIRNYLKGKYQEGGMAAPLDLDPKTMAKYKKALKNQENAGKAGYNKAQDRWYPHVSPEGGKKTIGYGHKLTTNNYANGLSTAEVESLLDSDILKHQAVAKKQVDEQYGKGTFDKLPQDSQMLLVDYAYNLGTLSGFPNFVNGVVTGDKEKMLAEHKRYSGTDPITRRNQWTADTINTMDTTTPSKINSSAYNNSTQTTKSNKDRWGRSPNTIWYGFNPETKLYEQKGLLWPQYGDPGPGIGGPLPGSYISPGQRLREYQEGLKKQSKGGQYQDGGAACPDGYYWTGSECVLIPKNTQVIYSQEELDKLNKLKKEQSKLYNDYQIMHKRYDSSNAGATFYKNVESLPSRKGVSPLFMHRTDTTNNYYDAIKLDEWQKILKKLNVKPIGYEVSKNARAYEGDYSVYPVYTKPKSLKYILGVKQEPTPVREKEEPIPILKPGLIDISKKDLIGEYQPYNVPEYATPEYKKYHPSLYFVHHTSNQVIPHPRPRIGKALETTPINKLVQKVTGYNPEAMEGFYDEQGEWIPGEIEQAQQEGRKIDFQGLSSLRDKKAQEKYNTEYDQYLNTSKYAQMLIDGLNKRGYVEDNSLSKNKRQKGGQYNIGDEVELTEAEVKRLKKLGYNIRKI